MQIVTRPPVDGGAKTAELPAEMPANKAIMRSACNGAQVSSRTRRIAEAVA